MIDYFALLNEQRRPWLDPDSLKQKFVAVSAQSHPDRVHSAGEQEKGAAQENYTLLNSAYNCLRDPKERLLHLLELEYGNKPQQVQNIPADLMDLLLEVSRLCREADTIAMEKAKASSPLLEVQLFEKAQASTEELLALQKKLAVRYDALMIELKTLDSEWQENRRSPRESLVPILARLEELYRLFSFFARWRGQVQERIVQLAF